MENYAYTDETKASDVAEAIVTELRKMVAESDDATVEDVLDALEAMAANYVQLAFAYRADERDAENKRWKQCEIDGAEYARESWTDLDHALSDAFRHFGPEGERCSPWDRTLAEPWRSIAEVWPRKPTRV